MPRPFFRTALTAPLVALLLVLSLQACGDVDAPAPPAAPDPTLSPEGAFGTQTGPIDETPSETTAERQALDSLRAWQCGDLRVETRVQDADKNLLALELPGDIRIIGPAISASGARFSDRGASGGDETVFWNQDDGALLMIDGAELDCVVSPQRSPWAVAREQGARLRAVGQEPNWMLTVAPDGSFLTLQLQRMGEPDQRWSVIATDEGRAYVAPDGAARVEVRDQACIDSMSGEVFPATVSLTLPKETLQGCGRHYAVEP